MNNKIRIGIIILIVILVIYLVVSQRFIFQNYQPYKNVWSDKNKQGIVYQNVVRNMLINTKNILIKYEIDIIPVYGTLLGLVRHQGIIPWDDDLDICIDKQKFLVLKSAKDEFAKYNIGIKDLGYYMKLYSLTEPAIPGYDWSWPFIDVFGYYIENDRVHITEINRTSGIVAKFSDFFPLKSNLFENIPLSLPNNPDSILSTSYGPNWEQVCVSSSYNHRQNKGILDIHRINCSEIQSVPDDLFSNTWVINLDNRPDRWEMARSRLADVGIIPTKWTATNANDPDFTQFYDNLSIPKRNKAEVACYISHMNLWKHIYQNNIPIAIIFEDDIVISPGITKHEILTSVKASNGFNVIFLGHCGAKRKSIPLLRYNFDSPYVRPGTAQCAHAYVITRNAIETLLQSTPNFSIPVDKILEQLCYSRLCFISRHVPNMNTFGQGIIHQDVLLGSDIIKV